MATSVPVKPRIFLSPPHMGAVELAFIEEAFRTNYIAPIGPHVDAFEREFASRFGFRHAAAVSSGTAAIHLSLRLLGVQPGDEVVCSSLTFAASANPIVYERARPVFIDSDEATWNMDPTLLENWMAERLRVGRLPRAVVAVDLYGQCADMARIAQICAQYKVPLIEDSAEALGATFAGRPAGSFGKTGIFSFNGNKIITTSGGGMLVSDDTELINKARFLATQARDPAQHYQHSQLGFNYRMSNVLAGIGRAQLQLIDERVDARRRIFAWYFEELKDLPGVNFMPEAPLSRSNRWLTCLTIDPNIAGCDNEKVRKTLELENIEARLVWKPLHLQPVFAGCEMIGVTVSERLFSQGLCLPSGSSMTEDDCMRVVEVVRSVFPGLLRKRKTVRASSSATPPEVSSLLEGVGLFIRGKIMAAARQFLAWSDRHIGRSGMMRFLALLATYAMELSAVFYLSYAMRWDFSIPDAYWKQLLILIAPVVLCKLVLLRSFGQFRSILSYYGLADFGAVILSVGTVSGMMMGLWYASDVSAAPPRGIVLMDFVLSVAAISAFRLSMRIMRTWSISGEMRPGLVERQVVIVGSGDAGQEYAKNLLQRRGCGLQPVFFLDDDPRMMGRSIHGLPIFGSVEKLVKMAGRVRVDELVVTQAGVSPERLREIVALGRRIGAATQIIPMFKPDRAPGARLDRRRPVSIEDLMGREPMNLDWAGIAQLIEGKVVLVAGAGGCIGSELCRQLFSCQPKQLVLVDRTESALFEIERDLTAEENCGQVLSLLADVADEAAMRSVFERCRPTIVFHAAGHKHVAMLERQPITAVRNNTLAIAGLAKLASEFKTERFVFVSTDKAISPNSVMGCSMRLAEDVLHAQQRSPENRTAYIAVRFGGILGSNGGLIPEIKRQIARGGPVTIAHPEKLRYFMTVSEAAGLILQAAALEQAEGVYVLDMGRPVKIMELTRQLIELSGCQPELDIAIKVTAVGSGADEYSGMQYHSEKTHEATVHSRLFKLKNFIDDNDVDAWLEELRQAVNKDDSQEIMQILGRLVPEYTPNTIQQYAGV